MRFVTDGQRHLICIPYSIMGLHAMAKALQIKRCWYHGGRYPHYDIPKTRIAEITARCEVVRPRDLLWIIEEEQRVLI